ncbi:MAG TPA: SCO family protein [Usitatibacter sp.]|nr:SCO family protein [Usitatibacter sp.]
MQGERRRLLLGLLALGAVAGCEGGPAAPEAKHKFNSGDISGGAWQADFRLPDVGGHVRTLADFFGKVVVVFFGFTQCPDVCPTTLLRYKNVMRMLDGDGDRLQVIFITIDPERDTPSVLKEYIANFDSRFMGLRGTPEETATTAAAFHVFYEKVAGPTPTSYTMNHSTFGYAFDKGGHARLLIPHNLEAGQVADDLRYLIES